MATEMGRGVTWSTTAKFVDRNGQFPSIQVSLARHMAATTSTSDEIECMSWNSCSHLLWRDQTVWRTEGLWCTEGVREAISSAEMFSSGRS